MEWTSIISVFLNLVFGGGFLVSLVTLKASRKKADAEVKTTELDNVQEAVKIWREMAESLKSELESYKANQNNMTMQLEGLRKEVAKLSSINNKMVKLLDKITPENLEQMVEQIKKIHENNV